MTTISSVLSTTFPFFTMTFVMIITTILVSCFVITTIMTSWTQLNLSSLRPFPVYDNDLLRLDHDLYLDPHLKVDLHQYVSTVSG